ncbi:hypothetical protein FJZ40_05310 [Candidatus Shapirobacteria bacterium]|nr:hypothetical protein [Candidatus Shapirobacteria bacterium]
MGRISKRKIDPEIEGRCFEIFWGLLAQLKSPLEIREFLESLLSYIEQTMLAKRLAIAVLLARGYNYEEIDQTLKVSKSTIGTVQKQLLIGAPGYKKAVEKILHQEKIDRLWDKLEEIILSVSPPAQYGSARFEIKSQAGKELAKRKRQRSAI